MQKRKVTVALPFSQFIQKLNQSDVIYDVYLQTAEFAPVWTAILKIRSIFVHQTLTENPLSGKLHCQDVVSCFGTFFVFCLILQKFHADIPLVIPNKTQNFVQMS